MKTLVLWKSSFLYEKTNERTLLPLVQKVLKDMDRMDAFRKALKTWGRWIDTYADPGKTKVLFQGINTTHYR